MNQTQKFLIQFIVTALIVIVGVVLATIITLWTYNDVAGGGPWIPLIIIICVVFGLWLSRKIIAKMS